MKRGRRSVLVRLAAVLLLAACTLAGCADDGDDRPEAFRADEDGGADAAAPEPSVQEFTFGLGAAAGTPVAGTILPLDDGRRVSFEVPEGHGRLEATAEWTCGVPGPPCELEVELRRGEQSIQTAGFGGSPIVLAIDAPEEGRWTFWAFPSGSGSVVLDLQGTLTVRLS